MAKWNMRYYQGEDGYSDGDIELEILDIIRSKKDFNQVLSQDNRWALLYHLSPLRRNVLSWYPFEKNSSLLEIGAGCGALTGLFCERVKHVTAVELTKIRSEINYERNKKYDNLELITGNFNNIQFEKKFDYIILNGVLEYAGSFTEGRTPYIDFLKQIGKLLSSDGILLIAIENRLGLKYFNGTVEDHTSRLFDGLNEYKNINSVQTFSKSELKKLLQQSGYKYERFYYPFPDYKFPEMIFDEQTVNSTSFPMGNVDSVYNHDRYLFFDENKMIATFRNEGVLDHFSNSFIVETRMQKNLPESKMRYVKFSNKRRSEFQINTTINELDGKISIRKTAMTKSAKKHLNRMLLYYERHSEEKKDFINAPVFLTDNGIGMEYQTGRSLEDVLNEAISKKSIKTFYYHMDRLKAFLYEGAEKFNDCLKNPDFIEVFGDAGSDLPLSLCREDINIDYIPENIFYNQIDNNYSVIDYEWHFDFPIPVKFILWRSLIYYYMNNPKGQEFFDQNQVLAHYNISQEEHRVFLKWDEHFGNSYVAGGKILDRYLKSEYSTSDVLNDYLLKEDNTVEVFYGNFENFSEKTKLTFRQNQMGTFELELNLDKYRNNGISITELRVDPCNFACVLSDLSVKMDGEAFKVRYSNAALFKDDKWFFPDSDPHFYIDQIYDGYKKISISGKIRKMSLKEILDFSEGKTEEQSAILSMAERRLLIDGTVDSKKLALKKLKYTSHVRNSGLLYHFDDIFFDHENMQWIIRGWGFSTIDKGPFNIQFYRSQVESAGINRFVRKDVNDVNQLDPETESGFEIYLKTNVEPVDIWAFFIDSRKISEPIRFGNFMTAGSELLTNFYEISKNHSVKEALEYDKTALKIKNFDPYRIWINQNEEKQFNAPIETLCILPKISIVVPVYNVEECWLRQCIESVLEQNYPNWELCLADDHSSMPYIKQIIDEYVAKDSRIKVTYREENGHISEATNTAITMTKGDYIAFLDDDDMLAPNALYENVKMINQYPDTDFLYSDEDKIDAFGKRFDVFFKSGWNPELLLRHNYITHLVVVKKSLVLNVGMLNSEMNGAQDYDFVLRATEKAKHIVHIPKVLYHWRMTSESTAENPDAKKYAYSAGKKAIARAFERRKISGKVELAPKPFYGLYCIKRDVLRTPKITVVLCRKVSRKKKFAENFSKFMSMTHYSNFRFVLPSCLKNVVRNADFIDDDQYIEKIYTAKALETDYVFFWDGVFIPNRSDWIDVMLNFFVDPETGAVGGKIVSRSRVMSGGLSINTNSGQISDLEYGMPDEKTGYYFRNILSQNVFGLRIEGMMTDVSILKKLGGIGHYVDSREDGAAYSICLRKQGKRIVWTPEITFLSYRHSNYGIRKLSTKFRTDFSENCLTDPYYNKNLIHYFQKENRSK